VVPPYAEEWQVPAIPQDVEVDPSGRVWVSCADDSIRVYTPTGGDLLFVFGGTGTGDGEFMTPYGIAFDPGGDAYICDYAGARLQKFTSAGAFIVSWPIPSDRADHVAVDAAGDVYVTGYTNLTVHKYTSTGAPVTDWPTNGGTRPSGIVEAGGTIHVVQWDASGVEQFDADGMFLGSFDPETLGGDDIEVDALNQLWIADYYNHRVRAFTTSGVSVEDLGVAGSGPGEFLFPIGIACGPDGSLYVAEEGNTRIQRFGDAALDVAPDARDVTGAAPAIRAIAPNPCRAESELTYTVPAGGRVKVFVTDVRGRLMAMLADGHAEAGEHQVRWTPRDAGGRRLAAGVYLLHVANGSGASVRRMTVVK
jgi:streptogramin lyase